MFLSIKIVDYSNVITFVRFLFVMLTTLFLNKISTNQIGPSAKFSPLKFFGGENFTLNYFSGENFTLNYFGGENFALNFFSGETFALD